ncbi:MAG: ABC transporter ATP-binding protein/permease, partial [Anaerolineae bacterium]|nr:ABC transporter ATP-binding protein/permease [Anaerolineae bacterium]
AQPYWTAAREASADQFGFLEEQLSSTEDIRSSGAVGHVMRGLFKVNTHRLETERKAGVMNILVVLLWIGSYSLAQVMAFVSGYYLFQSDIITIGTVYLIVYYTDAIYRPLREITNEIQNLQKAGASIERVEQLYAVQPTIQDGSRTLDSHSPHGLSVTFENITFGYEDDETVLKNLSFQLQPGTVLGLLGRTGSGKTTITRLLFRLFEPRQGTIYLNETPLQETRQADLRGKIGMVTQNVQLFRATIRDNLTFFDKSISDDRLMEVIEELELMNWYHKLPKGLDTELEAGGGGLSAGEAQLLAFARVFLKDPGLVILDEASSRLDPATEQLIERAIDKLLKNRTAIIVAHRLGTVERADDIMILQDGEILEYDAYNTLVLDPESHFYQLRQTGLKEVLA